MKKIYLITLITLLLIITGCSSNNNANSDDSNLVFSTQGLGTSMNTMANSFSTVIKDELPEGAKVDIQTTSPGGIAASYIISEDKADLTIGNTAPAKWATTDGIEDKDKAENVSSLGGGFDAPVTLAIFTDDFIDESGYSTLEEVIDNEYPVKIALKDTGSFGEMTARKILEQLGVSYDDIESWGGSVTLTDSSNVVDLLKDGRADITIDHTNVDQPNYVELAMTSDVHVVELDDSTRESLLDEGYAEQVIPKGSFEGAVEEDIETVGSPTALLVSESVSEDTAYEITKAIAENKETLVKGFASFEDFEPEEACKPENSGAELHEGAEKYYKENGCLD